MTLWILMAAMSLVAIGFAAWPLYRQQRRITALIALTIVGVAGLSAGLYHYNGSPGISSASAQLAGENDMISALAGRLETAPNDLDGWLMLGRSYTAVGNFMGAADAFEKAMELEAGQNAQTLVSLGESLLSVSELGVVGRISTLFEDALVLEPNNSQALFYGGIGAFKRGNQTLAADRWELLLTLNPPAEIEGKLRHQIAEWRGEAPAALADAAVISADISVSPAALESLPGDAIVFVIARDPAQPGPPIAVVRRVLSDFPTTVALGDGDSMVAGRSLSAYVEFELIARVSVSGQPAAQPGDWYGSLLVNPAENNRVQLSIDQVVP